jgi:hypothetical protein
MRVYCERWGLTRQGLVTAAVTDYLLLRDESSDLGVETVLVGGSPKRNASGSRITRSNRSAHSQVSPETGALTRQQRRTLERAARKKGG